MSKQDKLKLNETIPGGRYRVGGQLVDANGKAISDAGLVKAGVKPADGDPKPRTKAELTARLDELKVEYDPKATNAELEKLVAEAEAKQPAT
jgi:hypothetical protein